MRARVVALAPALLFMGCGASVAAPTAEDLARGEALFRGRARSDVSCASCHGDDARGGRVGPNLRARASRASDEAWVETILDGEDVMPAFRGRLDERDARKIVAFLRRREDAQ